jgi:PPOX class probable F420-dependent enzyme
VTPEQARERFSAARVARLATADATGRPHVVPVCFCVDDGVIWTAVDEKPKSTRALKRLRNVAENPRVALLADHYEDDDWSALWWVRADGVAHVVEDLPARVRELLVARYAQYVRDPPAGPALAVEVGRWSGWSGWGPLGQGSAPE